MDFGVTGKLWEYGAGSRTSAMKERRVDGSFAEIAAAKAAEKEASLRSVNEMRTAGILFLRNSKNMPGLIIKGV